MQDVESKLERLGSISLDPPGALLDDPNDDICLPDGPVAIRLIVPVDVELLP